MSNQCSTCFFSFVAPASADAVANNRGAALKGLRFCNHDAPNSLSNNPNGWLWPQVADDWWCGEGASMVDGTPFAAYVNNPPGGSASTGTFSFASQSSVTVTDAACKATSIIKAWSTLYVSTPGEPWPPSLTLTPGAGTFGAATADSSTITGTYGYTIYN